MVDPLLPCGEQPVPVGILRGLSMILFDITDYLVMRCGFCFWSNSNSDGLPEAGIPQLLDQPA
jgi:hypothetical protein